MKFVKVPETEFNTINFKLPAEPAGNAKIPGGARATQPAVYVDCPQWGCRAGWARSIRQR
jgi:hypothetical protein